MGYHLTANQIDPRASEESHSDICLFESSSQVGRSVWVIWYSRVRFSEPGRRTWRKPRKPNRVTRFGELSREGDPGRLPSATFAHLKNTNDVAQLGRALASSGSFPFRNLPLRAGRLQPEMGRWQRVIFTPSVPGSSPGIVPRRRAEMLGYH